MKSQPLPLASIYKSANGMLSVIVPYGQNIPAQIKDLSAGLSWDSELYPKRPGDTIDWSGKQYVISFKVRTYKSKLLGLVQVEYQHNSENFSHLPKEAKEKLGDLILIGNKVDLREINDENAIREIFTKGFYLLPPPPKNSITIDEI